MTDLRGKRVATYARYSTDRQTTASIEDQIAKVRAHVAGRGGDLALIFRDDAVSGAVRERPGLLALVRAVEDGRVDVVVCEDLGRLSRDVEDLAWLRKRLVFHGVRLVAIDDGIDSDNAGAELMGDVLGSFKSLYRREIAAKTLRGHEGRARAGLATGGVPYGYRTRRVPYQGGEASAIEIHEEHARIVREIFSMYADAGLSIARIATALNERGIAPPRASHPRKVAGWGISTVRAVLHNTCYVGSWSYGKKKWQRDPDSRRRQPRARDEVLVTIERPELVIVDRATWEAVHTRFSERRAVPTGRGRKVVPAGPRLRYPLSGVLRCAHCGSLLTIGGGEAERRYYRCAGSIAGRCDQRHSIRETIARERIIGAIRERFASPAAHDLIAAIVAEEMSVDDENGARRRDVAVRLEQSEGRVRRLVLALADGDAPESVLTTIRTLESQIRTDRAELAALAAAPRVMLDAPSPAEVLEGLDAVFAGPADGVRAALRRMLDGGRIDVRHEDDGTIYARGGLLPAILLGREVSDIAGARKARCIRPQPCGFRLSFV